jgi:hypothetical protein
LLIHAVLKIAKVAKKFEALPISPAGRNVPGGALPHTVVIFRTLHLFHQAGL